MSLFAAPAPLNALDQPPSADVALIVSVDVSESVDEDRYRLQMDGIAKALIDPAVIDAVTSGPKGRILFAMVVWADHAQLAVPWTPISSASDASALASTVRHLKRYSGEFTCLARMFTSLNDTVLSAIPMKATRTIVDVSGDGIDNCSPDATTREARDVLVKRGVTINGLPIIEEPGQIAGSDRPPRRAPRAHATPLGAPLSRLIKPQPVAKRLRVRELCSRRSARLALLATKSRKATHTTNSAAFQPGAIKTRVRGRGPWMIECCSYHPAASPF